MCDKSLESIAADIVAALAGEKKGATGREILNTLSAGGGVCALHFDVALRQLARQKRLRSIENPQPLLPGLSADDLRLMPLALVDAEPKRHLYGGRWSFAEADRVGRGGFAQVYRGRDEKLGRVVAIKILRRDALNAFSSKATLEFFRQEPLLQAKLNHPHIVQVYDMGEEEDLPYFVAEFVEGPTLAVEVAREGPLSIARAYELFVHLAGALDYALDRGLIHRDIKPANVLLQGDKLADFGLAKLLRPPSALADGAGDPTQSWIFFLGSEAWAAPETFKSGPVDHRADLYSLAATIRYALTGQLLFDIPSGPDHLIEWMHRHFNHVAPPVAQFRPDCPPEIDGILARCLKKSAGDRYANYKEVLADLRRLAPRLPRTTAQSPRSAGAIPSSPPPDHEPARATSVTSPGSILLRDLDTQLFLVTAKFDSLFGPGALTTNAPLMQQLFVLAQSKGIFSLCERVLARAIGIDSVPDFATRYLARLSAFANGERSPAGETEIPLDFPAYAGTAIRLADGERSGAPGMLPNTDTAEALLRFLEEAIEDPALLPFRCAPAAENLGALSPVEGQAPKPTTGKSAVGPRLTAKVSLGDIADGEKGGGSLPQGKTIQLPNAGLPEGPYPIGVELEGKFLLQSLLGKGGMGAVFRAQDKNLHRTVAIKVLEERLFDVGEATERFLREARTAAQLDPHPNIVPVYYAGKHEAQDGKHESLFFIVMQLVKGRTLTEHLKVRRHLPVEEALGIVRQAAQGLAHAHAAGLIHRDIKPDNLMLDVQGVVKIMDFGLMRSVHPRKDAITEKDTVLGTLEYASPEQLESRPLDPRTDLYSLGVVLYELLSGGRPYVAETKYGYLRMIPDEESPPKPIRSHDATASLPDEVESIVNRMIAKKPGARFQSADEVIKAIDAVLQGRAPEIEGATPAIASAPRRRRSKPLLISALILLAIAAGAYHFWPKKTPGPMPRPSDLSRRKGPPARRPDVPNEIQRTNAEYESAKPTETDKNPERVETFSIPKDVYPPYVIFPEIDSEWELVRDRTCDIIRLRETPSRDESVERFLVLHVPSESEAALLDALHDLLARRLPDFQARRYGTALDELAAFERDSRHTAYTRLHVGVALESVLLSRRAVDRRTRELRDAKEEVLSTLRDGTEIRGSVTDARPDEFVFHSGDRTFKVTLAEFGTKEFVSGLPDDEEILFRATDGDPVTALNGIVELSSEHPRLLASLGATAHLAVSRAIGESAQGKDDLIFATADLLERHRRVILTYAPYAGADLSRGQREAEALREFRADRLGNVLRKFEGTVAHDRAAKKVFAYFTDRLNADLIAHDQFMDWTLQPDEESVEKRTRFFDIDSKLDAVLLRDPENTRSLSRSAPQAKEGLWMEFRYSPEKFSEKNSEKPSWSLAFPREGRTYSRVDLTDQSLTLVSGKPVVEFKDPVPPKAESWRTLALIPLADLVAVYLDGRLAAVVRKDEFVLGTTVRISVTRSTLYFRKLRVHDED